MAKLIFSLGLLNLGLAVYLGILLSQGKARSPGSAAPSQSAEVAGPQAVAPAKAAVRPAEAKFHWSSLASPDLRRYAANLRAVGCPEQTIREILLAEVNRVYAPQEHALKVRPDDIAPWEKQPLYDRRNGEARLRQLLEEKRSLLKELTGVDVGVDMPKRLAGRDLTKFEGAFSGLPEDKRDQVRAIQENYWASSDDIKQRTMGYLEPEDREEFMRIKAERHDALAKVLSPRELQDYEMATSDTTPALRSRFQGFDVSDDEFRKVFDVMQNLDDQYSLSRRNPDPENQEFTNARSDAEKTLEKQIQDVLGEDRYAEYQRSRDPVYRSIKQAGAQAGLPNESILQAYDASQQMQSEAKRIMQDSGLTADQRAQSLQAMRDQAQVKFEQLFGEKGAQMLQQLPQNKMLQRYGIPVNRAPALSTP